MTVQFWLKTATTYLQSRSIATARLDALVLLEDVSRIKRTQLLAEPLTEISDVEVAVLQKLLKKRSTHLPLAYIRGRTEFYGRDFVITSAVLEPRPESETMISLLKALCDDPESTLQRSLGTNQGPKVADIGTGSGALGITAALEVRHSEIELLEVDKKALEIARRNVDKFTLQIPVILSDLLTSSTQENDILLCNLPYVPDDYEINTAARHEPRLAIFGGPDGLDLYRKLFLQVETLQKQPLFILTESLPEQHEALAIVAGRCGYHLQHTEDFIQVFALQA